MTVTLPRRPGRARLAPIQAGLSARARSTPGRLSALTALAIVLAMAFGVSAVVGVQQRSGLVDDVRTRSGPLTVQAQQLYRALSDADATAASAFLQGGIEPPTLSRRYQQDITAASRALATAADSGGVDTGAVTQLSTQLPVYTGLVETARVYNRQGLPLGAAYLREASGLMRDKLLPAAKQLYGTETGRLADDRDGAGGFPWLTVPLALLLLAALVLAQRYLTRHTNRVFNPGLLTATAAGVVALLWLTISWAALASHLSTGRDTGSAQVEVFAQTRLVALQARADESLTLVARGNGTGFEQDYQRRMVQLVGSDGHGGLLGNARNGADAQLRAELDTAVRDVTSWRAAHRKVRQLDEGGRYPDAVKMAIGSGSDTAGTAFGRLDTGLDHSIRAANTRFTEQADQAGSTQTGATVGLGLFAALAAVAAALGIQRRAAEYR